MSISKILIFYEYFPPAVKSGGITRSLTNLSKFLSKGYQVFVFTGNRDLGEDRELDVDKNKWVEFDKNVQVFYSDSTFQTRERIKKIINSISPNVIYINGLFNPPFSFFPLLHKKSISNSVSWVIAPRGMLQAGALKAGKFKKRSYLKVWKLLGLTNDIIWHTTDQQEYKDILGIFGDESKVKIASNIPAQNGIPNLLLSKKKAELRIIYLSLISEKKNLLQALKVVQELPDGLSVTFDIFGPIKDVDYWKECLANIDKKSGSVKIEYKGEVNPAHTGELLSNYHLFFLLTQGENFGHAIFESLHAGTPVLLSDKTPWRNLPEAQAGWDMDLNRPDEIREKIMEIASWDEVDYLAWRRGAREFAEKFLQETDFEKQYQELFEF
ncbi:glycosyltransferase [Algoriphagus hitonicola]|uniref:Glycosyltransferase involved in cell wall bisynthesis n=1 Tax=Algoriphagus hitonicola TaxID=435880 RepID=A0A1I2XRI7_9BACT|nr:glycosyltransferase [Algoriphagus hitonicola]SFH16118.1 Glycosyltransferase involved in cell wall bisynthesis [Algoriphagus hitonicola]